MAFEVKKIDPLDLQPRKAVGVSLPFSGKAVFNSTFQTKDAIKTNLINFFLTARGERFLNPSFGNDLQNLLFENLDQGRIEAIKSVIRNDLRVYFPRVEVLDIIANGEPDSNSVQFSLRYAIKDSNIEDDIVINFE